MCKTKLSVDAAEPNLTPRRSPRTPRTPGVPSPGPTTPTMEPSTATSASVTSNYSSGAGSSFLLNSSTATASISSRTSLSSLRESLPENAQVYEFSEIRSATNNFLSRRQSFSSSSSTPSWRCSLRRKDVFVFQRKLVRPIEMPGLKKKLSIICRSHHLSVIKLLGASISGDYIYLVYDFLQGGNLSSCLRNPRNPGFTVLSSWMSRMQIAADLASGLDYIHNNAGLNVKLVHKYVKSSSVIVTEPSFKARICHFGAAELCGESDPEPHDDASAAGVDIPAESSPGTKREMKSSESRSLKFEGVRDYMSPELPGPATQKSDVYAFGVLILELLSGKEPIKYKYDRETGSYRRIAIVDTARDAIDGGGGVEAEMRVRTWVDARLKDSFPVEVAVKLMRVAVQCVHVDPDQRPNMGRVAGRISKLYLDSRMWSDRVRVPTDFSVSLAPR